MFQINAQIVNTVNAYTANEVPQDRSVGKPTESPPSAFWKRLTEAWGPLGYPTSQNGVATKLKMSQGSTRRWFTGEGLPETEVIREIANLGGVTIDWLLNETLPRSPIGKKTDLGKLLEVWEKLDKAGREHVYEASQGQLALQKPEARPLLQGTNGK